MDSLESLEATASFECLSGILMWGQLDCVLGAKRKLNNNILKFDGIRGVEHSKCADYQPIGHRYRCKALTGNWNKYDHELVWLATDLDTSTDSGEVVNTGRNIILCHESCKPKDIAEKASTVDASWNVDLTADVIYINRYDWGASHEPRLVTWKGRPTDVFLTDPEWKVDVPAKNRDLRVPSTTEQLMDNLNACVSGCSDHNGCSSCPVKLFDSSNKCCGLLCKDFTDAGDIYARLVFDDNRNLMGMCVFDDLGQRLYHDGDDLFTRSCHSYSPCSSSNSCCGEDTLSNSCHSYSDMTYSFDRALSLTDSMFKGPDESVIYEDSDVSYFYEEWEEKAYDYFEDFVDWLACLDMNA